MTTETNTTAVDTDKQRKASAISGGLFLIGLGVLIFTGWWWPGIMVVLGLAGGAELIFRGQIARGIGTFVFFWGIALVVMIVQMTNVPWSIVGPLLLIGVGVIILFKAFYLRE
jgi:predicted membrane-bound mannosyltransferase